MDNYSADANTVFVPAYGETLLCSSCFDDLGCTRIIAVLPQRICGKCARRCLGYVTELPTAGPQARQEQE
jgi:hypothetical protein